MKKIFREIDAGSPTTPIKRLVCTRLCDTTQYRVLDQVKKQTVWHRGVNSTCGVWIWVIIMDVIIIDIPCANLAECIIIASRELKEQLLMYRVIVIGIAESSIKPHYSTAALLILFHTCRFHIHLQLNDATCLYCNIPRKRAT